MKKKIFTLVIGTALILLAACGSNNSASGDGNGDKLAQLQESGTVTIGFANEAPYAYEENGELKGAAVDIATAVFKELGVENVESTLSDWSQLIPGVQAGQFDVITAGMAINPDRCENALFSEPEMQYGEGLIVPAGNPLGLESYEDIAANPDVTVVVMEGATEIEFLKQEGVSEDQITTAADIPATFSAVQSGRADATTGTEMTVKMALESLGSDELEFVESFEQPDVEGVPSYGAAAFSLNDTELRDAYNEKLAELKEDGTVAELLEANGFSGESNFVPVGEVTTEELCNGEV
ncbi:ectoine/hydroxyectoine ABC transporter substrate-binding protein EhuB [Oceanobacillus piezotolerans]|uniref:Ectoine/hydroxyectoine ABC transporter substrate-binding protein EhuB n=1 Tax=Oceanobacillus piezotolerans TaxID=2448030 RepID=A0A498D3Q1_9BACI|nr:ectoine/hydroxyectoine ABC transporter substrate-binding protein EhuB [Oceanobacillus piezotolerans]RLL42090.1 ectoine/hydroxyectoine ABC transporter substrate-binding protein EhuB [Oceanobacillus piezotolerans]